MNLKQKLSSMFETRIEKKRKEIIEARKGLNRNDEFGEKMYNYYGGWLDALDWFP